MKRALRASSCVLLALGPALPVPAAEDAAFQFFADEEKVITASRHLQPASQAPVAVDVITAEDIRASGAVNLWDLLRFRAGLDVVDGRQTSDGNRALVSVRGLAREHVAELQVLVDGRSVYDALASGVAWHRLPVQLQDIERIEIVRGPNAVLYGANAALGVINIITRKPEEKASLSLRQSFGNLGTRLTEASIEDARERFGWRLSHASRANDGYPKPPAPDSNDFLSLNTSNLRAWWRPSSGAELELFTGGSWDTAGVLSTRNAQTRGVGHFETLRWAQALDGGSSLELTGSRSESFNEIAPTFSGSTRQRYTQDEAELVQRLPWNDERSWTVWGGGYRRSVDYSDQIFAGRPRQEQRLARAFAHQTAAVAEKLVLSGGLSYENYADEPEYQAAALFAPADDHAFRLSHAAADTVPGLYSASANHHVAKTVPLLCEN